MKNNLVTFDQAKILRSIGFKELCLYNYDNSGNLIPNSLIGDGKEGITTEDLLESYNYNPLSERTDAPFLWQVQEWFVKYQIYIDNHFNNNDNWYFSIGIGKDHMLGDVYGLGKEDIKYHSYPEALRNGIDAALYILVKEKYSETPPCFLKKNTSEIREKLEELGFKPYKLRPTDDYNKAASYWTEDCYDCLCTTDTKEYYGIGSDEVDIKPELFEGVVDCGFNEDLFFALVSLRKDTDVNQWFTNGEEWKLSKADIWLSTLPEYHKATPFELLNYFKNEK